MTRRTGVEPDPMGRANRRVHNALAAASSPVISTSLQPGGLAIIHLVKSLGYDVPALFVDTGYHFQETLEFLDLLRSRWQVEIRAVSAAMTVDEQEAGFGNLYETGPDLCCQIRKTDPLFRSLQGHDYWLTGLRRTQSETRADTSPRERRLLQDGSVITKVNPIVDWTEGDLDAYTVINEIPSHPLLAAGFPSIGCAPCTVRADADDPRSGRWDGMKVECGIHTDLLEPEPSNA